MQDILRQFHGTFPSHHASLALHYAPRVPAAARIPSIMVTQPSVPRPWVIQRTAGPDLTGCQDEHHRRGHRDDAGHVFDLAVVADLNNVTVSPDPAAAGRSARSSPSRPSRPTPATCRRR